MESQWSDRDAAVLVERYRGLPLCNDDIALRVYSSRLIGRTSALVLHGGGNTSVKTTLVDDLGEPLSVLCVKGSGSDLADLEPKDLPALRLDTLGALRRLPALGDEQMVNALRTRLLDASAPNPSIETLLHAFLPFKFVDHSHADAILSLVDQPKAEELCRACFGSSLAIVPYVMPGFELAKLAAEIQAAHPQAEGLLLLSHGLFTFGASAREAYERHIRAVDLAERFVARSTKSVARRPATAIGYERLAPTLRGALGEGQRHYLLTLRQSPKIQAFLEREDLADICQRGPVTPDHVIRTKRLPLLLRARADASTEELARETMEQLAGFRVAYRAYVARETVRRGTKITPLDPDPRVVLVPGLGLIGVGTSHKAARIAADLYEHTIDVISDAEQVGRYTPLDESQLFDMEYWSLEQAKLGKDKPKPLAGRVVYITGAAGGLGSAIARAFAAQGAHLYLVDRQEAPLRELSQRLGAAYEAFEATDPLACQRSVERAVACFGGVDGLVANAGTAPQGPIPTSTEALRESLGVNLLSHQYFAAAVTEVLKTQGLGGFLLFNASKSAFNPGPDFGPYAVPKAALVALMKQYAIETAPFGIRANAVNADRIRTGLLPADDIEKRARARGLSLDDYYAANLLRREVMADDVAEAFVYLAGAKSTTGSVITVDGGNIAASPR